MGERFVCELLEAGTVLYFFISSYSIGIQSHYVKLNKQNLNMLNLEM